MIHRPFSRAHFGFVPDDPRKMPKTLNNACEATRGTSDFRFGLHWSRASTLTLAKNMGENDAEIRAILEEFVERLRNPPPEDKGVCESPIEEDFLWALEKVTNDNVRIWRQRDVDTKIGRFRLDFLLERLGDGMSIGIECDGKDFHSPERDAKRDAAIVSTGVVDKIYRITGHDIVFHLEDSIQMIAILEPWIVSERGADNLRSLSHPTYLKEDQFGRAGIYFPYCGIRFYTLPEDEEWCEDRPFRPTIIHWTTNEER
jgi:very-short-patch-repair endonuclease